MKNLEQELKKYESMGFDAWQMDVIRNGLEQGLDVSEYANHEYNEWQMLQIRLGLEQGLDVSKYADPKYNEWQMEEIRLGLEQGLDISMYADPKYDAEQMEEIRYGLKQGLDVSKYADPNYDYYQMEEIRYGLKLGLDVSKYADPNYDYYQMYEIRKGLLDELDVSIYADHNYDYYQMEEVTKTIKESVEGPEAEFRTMLKTPIKIDGLGVAEFCNTVVSSFILDYVMYTELPEEYKNKRGVRNVSELFDITGIQTTRYFRLLMFDEMLQKLATTPGYSFTDQFLVAFGAAFNINTTELSELLGISVFDLEKFEIKHKEELKYMAQVSTTTVGTTDISQLLRRIVEINIQDIVHVSVSGLGDFEGIPVTKKWLLKLAEYLKSDRGFNIALEGFVGSGELRAEWLVKGTNVKIMCNKENKLADSYYKKIEVGFEIGQLKGVLLYSQKVKGGKISIEIQYLEQDGSEIPVEILDDTSIFGLETGVLNYGEIQYMKERIRQLTDLVVD